MTHRPELTPWPDDDEIDEGPNVKGFTFWQALMLAWGTLEPFGAGADAGPLADYLVLGPPLSTQQQAALGDLQRLLPTRQPRGGRGKAKQPRSVANEEERQEALRVIAAEQVWLLQNPTRKGKPRRNVPGEVTRRMVGPGFGVDRIMKLRRDKKRLSNN